MLSFGAAPASSCSRGSNSSLPDYLPEEDDGVVISDKVSLHVFINHGNLCTLISPTQHSDFLISISLKV